MENKLGKAKNLKNNSRQHKTKASDHEDNAEEDNFYSWKNYSIEARAAYCSVTMIMIIPTASSSGGW